MVGWSVGRLVKCRWVSGWLVGGSVSKRSVTGWSVGRWLLGLIKPLLKLVYVLAPHD